MNEELDRIRSEYIKRDATGSAKVFSYSNPAFLYHMQERERGLIRALERARVELAETDILEVGCGTGHILQRFIDFGARSAVGVELMPHRIKMGSDKYPAVRMLCGNGGCLPFRSESFGLVMQFMCLSSVLDSKLREHIAAEMWRVLSPGGVVLLYDLRPSSILRSSINYVAQHLKPTVGNGKSTVVTPIQPLGIDEFQRLFAAGSMKAVSMSLNMNLAALARVSWSLACVLSAVPALHSHYLVVIRKPMETNHGAA
jgi:SAM-dependent methyltransferase